MTDSVPRTLPTVSVIIPAFNAERTLEAQLEALSRQDVPFEWELLVCDNGSIDGTARVAEFWRNRLPQLRLIDASARRGAGAARNVGAAQARASQLVFCDADDVVADDWLGCLRSSLMDSDLVIGAAEADRLNIANRSHVSWNVNLSITKPYWPQFAAGGGGNLGVASSVFWAVGGFDESLPSGEDIDLCWRIQLAGHTLTRCERAVVHVRKHTGLRRIYRQAYSYALGDRQLEHKYSAYIDAYSRTHPESVEPGGRETPLVSGPRNAGGLLRRAARLLSREGRADAAWRLGSVRGARTNSVDFSHLPVFELAP